MGEGAPEDEREHEHRPRLDGEDQPPAAELGQQARHRPREQDADQQAAHDRADDPAALRLAGQRGRERHDDLGDRGRDADDEQRRGQDRERRRHGAHHLSRGYEQDQHDDQPPPLDEVAERHQQGQPEDVADLAGRDEEAGRGLGHVERPCERVEERLGRVQVRDRQPARQGEQEDEPPVQPVGGRGRGRGHPGMVAGRPTRPAPTAVRRAGAPRRRRRARSPPRRPQRAATPSARKPRSSSASAWRPMSGVFSRTTTSRRPPRSAAPTNVFPAASV